MGVEGGTIVNIAKLYIQRVKQVYQRLIDLDGLYVFVDREANGGIFKYKIWDYPGTDM